MSANENGGPAFPVPGLSNLPNGDFIYPEAGMTLRDYFAAKAMQVCLAQCPEFPDETWRTGAAMDAYAMADAMLKERAK
ncbi:hypothetical protein [Methyloversatilis discipulorum]|uniref:hypothetical protein n=1 Tax=Methyloversatilis discipulorum TaxID=1119528 RepID=UPI00048E8A2B|nr:hypothetical protein [Methyloversatilis discipulorum]